MPTDPVLLDILATKFAAAAEEMALFLKRTGRTLFVKEAEDFATALVDKRGRIFAYPSKIGISGFFDLDCGPTLEAIGPLGPGDVVITNHPYLSQGLATHLPDLHLIRPYFVDDELVCYGWSFVHSSDVGGRVPSSISPSNSDLYQEGLALPPVMLVRGGAVNQDVLSIIRTNSRTPAAITGDIRAMLAALDLGERRIGRIVAQHGAAAVAEGIGGVLTLTASKARAAFRLIPDGTYSFSDYVDDDYLSGVPLRIRVAITVNDGLVHLDFTGTDPSTTAAFNLVTFGRRHSQLTMWLTAYVRTRDPSVLFNSGLLDPVSVTSPEGSLINPRFPAATGVRHATVGRVADVLNGAIAKALPDFAPAAGAGINIPTVFVEPGPDPSEQNVIVVQPLVGGGGARKGDDGTDGRYRNPVNISNNPIELVEAVAGIEIIAYRLRPDSGGPGRWRGGCGVELTFTPRSEATQVLGRGMDRFRFAPWGLAGGKAGAVSRTVLDFGLPTERELGCIDVIDLPHGRTITLLTPGGGGYGDPLERPLEAVAADLAGGFVTPASAYGDYGVVTDEEMTIDADATARRRAEMRGGRAQGAVLFDFGPTRERWEAAFDDELLCRLARDILRLPVAARARRRRELIGPLAGLAHGADLGQVDLMATAHAVRAALADAQE